MLDRAKEALEIFKAAIRFATQAVADPRAFVAEFFAGPEDSRRWFDFGALIAILAGVEVVGIAIAAGPDRPLPSTPWMVGLGVMALVEVTIRASILFPIIRMMGGRASFAATLQAIAFPGLASAIVAHCIMVLFYATGLVAFVILALVVGAVLGLPSTVVSLAAVHRTTVAKAATSYVVYACVVSTVLSLTSREWLWRVWLPARGPALEIADCMDGTAESSLLFAWQPECSRPRETTLPDGGSAFEHTAQRFKLGELPPAAPDAGHWIFCNCPVVTPDMKRRVAVARSCVEGVKTKNPAAQQLKASALLALDALSVAREECDIQSLLERESDYHRHFKAAASW